MKITFSKVHNEVSHKCKYYEDACNHTKKYRDYLVRSSLSSSVHEVNHCISSDLRINNNSFATSIYWDNNDIEGVEEIQPIFAMKEKSYGAGRNNAFYVGNNTAYVFPEPNLRKSDCIPFIQDKFKLNRYKTYITGQTAWDDTPLYIYDEWNAYIAGTECAIELGQLGITENKGTDISIGPLEFAVYSLALCMAIDKKDPSYLTKEFIEFTQFQLDRSIKSVNECLKYFEWKDTNTLINDFFGPNGMPYRRFLSDRLGTTLTRQDFNTI